MSKLPKVVSTPIIFTGEDTRDVMYPHDDALATIIKIDSKDLGCILISTDAVGHHPPEQVYQRPADAVC